MKYKIAFFPGDGVGPELAEQGIKIIDKAAELGKFEIEWVEYPYGADHLAETKETLSEKILKEIKNSCNAIYCGTFDVAEQNGKNIPSIIRNYFEQFVALRPIKLFPTVESPLSGKTHNEINFTLIRENTEDLYVNVSGTAKNGRNRQQLEINNNSFKAKFSLSIETKGSEIAYQIGVLSKKGCERIARYAFEYAKRKNMTKISAIDKANMLNYHKLWRESFDSVAKDYDSIKHEFSLIGSTIINLIRQPEKYEIIVAPNMLGDILSDLCTTLQGSVLFAARGSINPQGISMFEPVHGSAPKLKGQGILNPIATIYAGALMLDNIGQQKSSDLIIKSIEFILKDERIRTQDIDGHNTTAEMAEAILDKFVELHD